MAASESDMAAGEATPVGQTYTMKTSYIRDVVDLRALVKFGVTPESITLEFKTELTDWNVQRGTPERDNRRRLAQKELARDVAQFANTDGGVILIGITEQLDRVSGRKIAAGVAPLVDADGLIQWIEQAITNFLAPATFSREVSTIQLESDTVLALNVYPSRYLVALWDPANHTVEYLRRTSHGKTWLNPEEAERHLMNSSRAARLALLEARSRASDGDHVDFPGGFWGARTGPGPIPRWKPSYSPRLVQVSDEFFEISVALGSTPHRVTLPFDVVRSVWVGPDGKLQVLLTVPLVVRDDQINVEPFWSPSQ